MFNAYQGRWIGCEKGVLIFGWRDDSPEFACKIYLANDAGSVPMFLDLLKSQPHLHGHKFYVHDVAAMIRREGLPPDSGAFELLVHIYKVGGLPDDEAVARATKLCTAEPLLAGYALA